MVLLSLDLWPVGQGVQDALGPPLLNESTGQSWQPLGYTPYPGLQTVQVAGLRGNVGTQVARAASELAAVCQAKGLTQLAEASTQVCGFRSPTGASQELLSALGT